jgi:hypothetical protein
VCVATVAAVFGSTTTSSAQPLTTTTYRIGAGSFSPCLGEQRPLCSALFPVRIETGGVLLVEVSFDPFGFAECGVVRFQLFLGPHPLAGFSGLVFKAAPLLVNPGIASGGVLDLGPVSPGTHWIIAQPLGVAGGCQSGPWTVSGGWQATLRVTTSALVAAPTSKDECKNGGWATFTNPQFKSQGDCVSYVATGGKNPPSG